jgi:prepilin-type processing-associated H-X9-DG protein
VVNTGDPRLLDKARHKGRIMVGFADGHVDNFALSEGDSISLSVGMRKSNLAARSGARPKGRATAEVRENR